MPFYTYVDLNAGAGRYYDHIGAVMDGSPLIALLMARHLGLSLSALLCEKDLAEFTQLQSTLTTLDEQPPGTMQWQRWHRPCHEDSITLWHGEATQAVIDRLTQWRCLAEDRNTKHLGLVYADPNGTVPFPLLQEAARALPQCEILIHAGGTSHKRQYYSEKHGLCFTFEEMLDTIKKPYWLIRKLSGPQQWTFLLGSAWKDMPRKLAGQDFYSLTSAEGASIYRRLNKRRQDLDGQGNLFMQGDV
jgi:hypothetical protein